MKKILLITFIVSSLLCGGCSTWNRTAYKTLGTIALTVNTAKHAYEDYRDKPPGHYDKATDDKLKAMYLHYQATMAVAEKAQASLSSGVIDKPAWQSIFNAVSASADEIVNLVRQFNPSFKGK